MVEHDADVIAGTGAADLAVAGDESDHLCLGGRRGIAEKLRGATPFEEDVPEGSVRRVAAAFPGLAGLRPLLGHGVLETLAINRAALAAQGVLGKIKGEAEGVIETEGNAPRQRGAAGKFRGLFGKQPRSPLQHGPETLFLVAQRLGDQRLGSDKFRKCLPHFRHQDGHQTMHDGIPAAQDMHVAHGAAHDPAQDIATPLIGGKDAIGNEERGGPQVIGDDVERGPRFPSGGRADTILAGRDQGREEIGVEIAPHTLQDGRHPLETHAGVDRGLRQVDSLIRAHLLVLHEHQVPELEEAVAILVRAAWRPALEFGTLIDEDLRTGSTRTGIAHRPEVVRCRDPNDPVVAKSRHAPPQRGGFLVG